MNAKRKVLFVVEMSEQRCRQDMNYRRCGRCEWTFAHCDLPTETQEILQETLDSAWRTCCDVGAKTWVEHVLVHVVVFAWFETFAHV